MNEESFYLDTELLKDLSFPDMNIIELKMNVLQDAVIINEVQPCGTKLGTSQDTEK